MAGDKIQQKGTMEVAAALGCRYWGSPDAFLLGS
jgi:hypothetical protein